MGLSGNTWALLQAAVFYSIFFAAIVAVIAAAIKMARFVRPLEGKFGLEAVGLDSYEGEMAGVRVSLDHDDDKNSDGGWTITLAADCAGVVELFAHQPMAGFDRPLRSLLGPLRRFEAPASFGTLWAFWGAPAAGARMLSARLPRPRAAALWKQIELSGGSLEVIVESGKRMSEGKLQRQVAAFREVLEAVRR